MLHDFLDKAYSSFKKRNKFHSFFRVVIRTFSDIVLPVYFRLFPSKSAIKEATSGPQIIVTLTSFPGRISRLWLVIECLLRQKRLPNKIILWLSFDQFPNGLSDLPYSLKKFYDRKLLTVEFVPNDIRSHKKYFYAFKRFPNDIIITVDDDIYYSSNIIEDLLALHEAYPEAICCLRGYRVTKEGRKIQSYKKWEKLYREYGPATNIFHTSGGGTLYKRDFFNQEVLNLEVFSKYCFHADDVWLNFMAQLNGTEIVKGSFYSHLIPISSRSSKLSTRNVVLGGNDTQLNNLINYYNITDDDIFR